MKYVLSILGIPFLLEFSSIPPLQLSSNLIEYKAKGRVNSSFTQIQFVQNAIHLDSENKPLGHNVPSLQMISRNKEYLYYNYMYQLLADRGFRRILLWSQNEESLSLQRENKVAYDGFPTLFFIVWGRAVHEGFCFFHGALNAIDGSYFLLCGDSGIGKSTLSKLICSAGGTCLTDENPYLGIRNEKIHGFSTPWPGSVGKPITDHAPIRAVFFLRHAKKNILTKLSPKEAARKLIHNSRTFNWQPGTIPRSLEIIERTAMNISCYDLGFLPDQRVIQLIKNVL